MHVDFGDNETIPALRREFPNVGWITSDSRQGPGGGRNRLITAASHECITSLDDDSWPVDIQFFGQAVESLLAHQTIAVLACPIIESDGDPLIEIPPAIVTKISLESATPVDTGKSFVGCGAVIRKSAFQMTSGYLPLRYAYGMEEADIALQLLDAGWKIGMTQGHLQVVHACERANHHSDPRINAAHIRNTALLSFLRYPRSLWWRGALQTINRTLFSIRTGRFRGILSGWAAIPTICWTHRHHRRPVRTQTLRHFWADQ